MTNDRETILGVTNDLECMVDWLTSNVLDSELPLSLEKLRELIATVESVSDVLNSIEAEAQT